MLFLDNNGGVHEGGRVGVPDGRLSRLDGLTVVGTVTEGSVRRLFAVTKPVLLSLLTVPSDRFQSDLQMMVLMSAITEGLTHQNNSFIILFMIYCFKA